MKTNTATYFTNYASYTQGVYKNATLLAMSRGRMFSYNKFTFIHRLIIEATKALSYGCQYANATVSTFDSVWYCYTPFMTSSPTGNYILKNACGQWVTGGTVIKFIHPAEPGYLSMRIGANAYTGVCIPTGSSTYKYFDNDTIPAIYNVWDSGYPTGNRYGVLNNNLLLFDAGSNLMSRLMCRNIATPL